MRSSLGFRLFLFLTFCALAITAQAGVISTTGSILFIDPPPSGLTLPIPPNTLESNDIIRLYYFRNVPRSTDEMDFCQPGTFTSFANAPNCYLPSNFVGDLAYIYFDPVGVGDPDPLIVRSGSVTFGTDIVAILAGGSYGLWLGSSSPDSVTFSADRRTVGLTLGKGGPLGVEQVAVWLNSDSVPEPSSLLLAATGIGGALLLRIRMRRSHS